jgi:hypothetical protein
MPLDVVLAGPGVEELFLARARLLAVEDVTVPVASPEDIVVMKGLAGRAKDLDDAGAILAANDRRDLVELRRTLRLLEEALDQSDLEPETARATLSARRRSRATSRVTAVIPVRLSRVPGPAVQPTPVRPARWRRPGAGRAARRTAAPPACPGRSHHDGIPFRHLPDQRLDGWPHTRDLCFETVT